MSVIPLKAAQLPLIQELAHKIWPHAYAQILSPAQLHYMLGQFYSLPALETQLAGKHYFLMLLEKEKPIGFAAWNVTEEACVAKLQKLYVLPGKQGTGGGKALLQEVEKAAKKAGAAQLTLNVNRYNKAVEFYRRQGFSIILEEDIAIGSGFFMNDYQMAKVLL